VLKPTGRLGSRTADLRGNSAEGRGSTRTDSPDGSQADDDDQRQHHRVLDRGWAIFRLQETLDLLSKILHNYSPTPLGVGFNTLASDLIFQA
jgi:hypothetical protein